ncbi:Hypothetical protein GLP15_3136 [Giardia lamblia P15]|uniref:Coiled-coil protein n=1 Tax=Giardia intestinalis (strain P15) TaxID=658858 RepID=E1EVR2_GIAIA|nr:Hypothetical protein GLP15_3136 [Giardia lamblia P15]
MSTGRECAQCNWVMDKDDVDLTVATMVSDILQHYSRDSHKNHSTNRSGSPCSAQTSAPPPEINSSEEETSLRPITHRLGNVPRPASMNAVADVKTRLKEYKQRVNYLETEIRTLEQTLIDERTKASIYQMEQEQLITTMKESFKQENLKLLASNKQIIEKLLAEKKDLADKYEDLANELHKAKLEHMGNATAASENEILKAQLDKLKQEHVSLKTTFDEQLEKAKHRIQTAESKKRKQAVEEAIEQTKHTLALGLEPKLQEMDLAHKTETLKLTADHEAALRKQKQDLTIQHEETLVKQRTEIMKQTAEEIDQLREEMQQKIKRVKAELQHEHSLELETTKKKLQMEHDVSVSTELAKMRGLLNEKTLECDILNDKLQKLSAEAQKSIEQLKLSYISEVDKYRVAYANEISVIKTQYKELARTLWLQSKPEMVEQVRAERDKILKSMAKTWDEKIEAARLQERTIVTEKEAEIAAKDVKIKDLQLQILNVEAEISRYNTERDTLTNRIAHLVNEKDSFVTRQAYSYARLQLSVEDYRCRAIRQQTRRRDFEAKIKDRVQEKLLTIVQEKDTLIAQLTEALELEQQRSAEYVAQLTQLQELTNAE